MQTNITYLPMKSQSFPPLNDLWPVSFCSQSKKDWAREHRERQALEVEFNSLIMPFTSQSLRRQLAEEKLTQCPHHKTRQALKGVACIPNRHYREWFGFLKRSGLHSLERLAIVWVCKFLSHLEKLQREAKRILFHRPPKSLQHNVLRRGLLRTTLPKMLPKRILGSTERRERVPSIAA